MSVDMVEHPPHYNQHPSGVEVIEITEHLSFCAGNAFKYLARAPHKSRCSEDLRKAVWYLKRVKKTPTAWVIGDPDVFADRFTRYINGETDLRWAGIWTLFRHALATGYIEVLVSTLEILAEEGSLEVPIPYGEGN